MYYLTFIATITLLTATLPWAMPRIAAKYGKTLAAVPLWLPLLAAFCYAISGFLPVVHISRETTTFQEHFVGGGLYAAILYIYFTRLFNWRPHWMISLLALFAWTSALGVCNELLEFAVTKLNITHIDISDTSWDLLANTAGSFAAYAVFIAINSLQKYINKV